MTYAVPGPIRTNIISSTSVGGIDSPFTRTRAVLDMMKGWEIMKAVTEGTDYLRTNSETFLPLERRLAKIIRPSLVADRALKPCRLFFTRLLG